MEIEKALEKNKKLLGADYSNLGKTKGPFFWPRKVVLSYKEKKGWEVRQLNIFQLFRKSLCGSYKSTKLDHVVKKLNDLAPLEGEVKKCHHQMQKLWMKKNLIEWGNCSITDAKVICFPEEHTDKDFHAVVVNFINEYYQEGDIILIEGIKVTQKGKLLPGIYSPFDFNSECVIEGWEPESFDDMLNQCFPKFVEYKNEIGEYLKEVIKKQNENDLEGIKSLLIQLIADVKKWNKYYQSDSEYILNFDEAVNMCLEENEEIDTLAGVLRLCLNQFQTEHPIYKNKLSKDERAAILAFAKERNVSLATQIQKYREEGKRVFVIAGTSHLFKCPNYPDCKEVREVLEDDSYIMIMRKDLQKTLNGRKNKNEH